MGNKFLVINCIVGLSVGFFFYFLLDDSVYVTSWIYSMIGIDKPILKATGLLRLVRIYGLDLIWAYSLWYGVAFSCFGFRNRIMISTVITALSGACFEILQFFKMINGTFDKYDIVANICGIALAIVVYKIYNERKD